jgi:hypothetical protein
MENTAAPASRPIGYSDARYLADLREMVQADSVHLDEALARGDRQSAHHFVDTIINRSREIQDLS